MPDEYIKREGALVSLNKSMNLNQMRERLKRLPTEDVMPVRHGEWKWRNGGECSECGFHNSNFDYNFCPNCGSYNGGKTGW